jgi:phosphate transport system substrate-binding protein
VQSHITLREISLKHFIIALTAFISVAVQAQITGAGATFPAPVYAKWAEAYNQETKTSVNYSAIGSGGGIKQIDSKTVDFGATDDPVAIDQLNSKGQYQFPTVIGGVVPVVNIRGVEPGQLVLDGRTLADIFEGRITKWDDAAIKKLNPTVALPGREITLAVRADSSGTTAVFTNYLTQVSDTFKKNVGEGKTVKWPGNNASGKGNAGVAAFVKQIDGAIGYVEYAYVKQNRMTYTLLKNRKGKVVAPDDKTFNESAQAANWNVPGMAANLNNLDGWPITAATFIIVYKDSDKSKPVIKFFDWAFSSGTKMAADLDYVPLPDAVRAQVRKDWKKLGF